tara:strand:+ start:432 stop:620 length:189 start_codon:yes stop_codon:yes gene_type:complete
MPFRVDKVGDVWKLFKLKEKSYAKVNFKSRMSAISAGKNYMRYRKEVPFVKGNMILNKKKMK